MISPTRDHLLRVGIRGHALRSGSANLAPLTHWAPRLLRSLSRVLRHSRDVRPTALHGPSHLSNCSRFPAIFRHRRGPKRDFKTGAVNHSATRRILRLALNCCCRNRGNLPSLPSRIQDIRSDPRRLGTWAPEPAFFWPCLYLPTLARCLPASWRRQTPFPWHTTLACP